MTANDQSSAMLGGDTPPTAWATSDASDGVLVNSTEDDVRFTEMALCRLRYVVAGLAVAMAAVLQTSWLPVAIALAAVSVGVSLYTRTTLRRSRSLPELLRLGRVVLVVDVTVAMTTYLLYLNDPHAIPVVFLPLLVFELAARYPQHGMAIGLSIFMIGLAIRVAFQAWVIPDGEVRPAVLLTWLMLCALLLTLGRELTHRDQLRIAAQQERERIAASFRTVIAEVLSRSGVPPHAARSTDVLEAIRRICEERSNEYSSLATRIASVLVPSARTFGLTRRELEIVGLLTMGYSYRNISRALFISTSTVRNHVHHVRTKLRLSSHEEIVAFARQQGLVPPTPPAATTAEDLPNPS